MAADILILAVVAVAAIMGFRKGIVSQIGAVAAVVIGVLAGRLFGPPLASFFADAETEPTFFETASGYLVAFIVGYLAVWIVASVLRTTVRMVHLGVVDRLGGAAFKVAQWLLLLSIFVNVLIALGLADDFVEHPSKPWRSATVSFAPAALGYLSELTAHEEEVQAQDENPGQD